MAELIKTKEELKRAKDSATQSWLDSRPLIYMLEKLQAGLASVKNRTSISNIVISGLKSQLEEIDTSIKTKKEEELKAMKMINEMNGELDQTREELEAIKQLTNAERRARFKLKQVLRMRRQNLRTLQLTLQATRIESEAFGASVAEAKKYINSAATDTGSTVTLTRDEYLALTRRAKEEASLADWRISVSMEQRLAAEATKNLALSRLRGLYTEHVSSRRSIKVETITKDERVIEEVEEEEEEEEEENVMARTGALPKASAEAIAKSNTRDRSGRKQQTRKSASDGRNGKSLNRKKKSILHKIRSFLGCIGRFFR